MFKGMKVIAITINKGGVGKTTTAKTLATAATAAGLTVLIIDMDTQQNSVQWSRRRKVKQKNDFPVVKFVTEGDLESEIERARAAGCDLVIIDTPPGRSIEAPAAVEAADLVLIPIAADDVDAFDGVKPAARLARMNGKPAAGILNFVFPGSKVSEETARGVLDDIGLPLAPTILQRFTAHRDANTKGLTAQEFEPGSRPAQDVEALWKWVCAELQNGTSARVHKHKKEVA